MEELLTFSRTPRGFEAHCRRGLRGFRPLSAEPLVGLKRLPRDVPTRPRCLSAEPLVGLKLRVRSSIGVSTRPFSRTPRGFEAIGNSYYHEGHDSLSAEPLVGLKRRGRPCWLRHAAFSRTPRGFEAR